MLNKLSYTLFCNSELIGIILTCLILSTTAYYILKKFNKSYLPISVITICYSVVSLWNLGSWTFPTTTWQPTFSNQTVIFEIDDSSYKFDGIYAIYGEGDNNANLQSYQIGSDKINIYGSADLNDWSFITSLEGGSIYQYNIKKGSYEYKYIKLECSDIDSSLSELAIKEENVNKFLNLKIIEDMAADSKYPATLLIDETFKIPFNPTYFDEGYFDEVYHPRNAWEIANGQYMYPTVHPLLGTSLIALSIKLLGLSPLAWRLPGAIFGILMIPLFYLIIKKLFKNEYLSNIGAILFACDFMHITTSRIGTLEPFSVFFILLMTYFMLNYFYETDKSKELKHLALSGLAMGLGWSTKWTVIYSSIGLAIIFFIALFFKHHKDKKYIFKTLLWCIILFIVIPLAIYYFSFSWTMVYRENTMTLQNIINHNINMYKYHKNLTATHPFQSVWYEWLLNIQPIWYYTGTSNNGLRLTISCFSNPIISYSGLMAIIYTFYLSIKEKSKEGIIISISFLSALLPWIGITRCLFVYHFYPSTPFLILGIVFVMNRLMKKENLTVQINVFTFICIFVFIMFLPVICGFETSGYYYNNFLKWLPSWYFGA